MTAPSNESASAKSPFAYEGPPELRQPVVNALTRVVDPEVALSIVDVALLHGSLALRLAGGLVSPALRETGAVLNAAALVLFAATVAGSALAWRAHGRSPLPTEPT